MIRYNEVVMTEESISGNELSRAASQPNRLIAEKSPICYNMPAIL